MDNYLCAMVSFQRTNQLGLFLGFEFLGPAGTRSLRKRESAIAGEGIQHDLFQGNSMSD